jgi:two-component system, chemotaxis family, CheB/CheR fusion protein
LVSDRHLIVGIGASAGGGEALQEFFRALPEGAGISFIVVMHLAEGRDSALPEILARCTSLPVHTAKNGLKVEPGNVYVLSSNVILGMRRGRLQVQDQ